MHSAEYTSYIQSPEWLWRREKALERAGYQCEDCGEEWLILQVHHVRYDNLGNEQDDDLKVLCVECHDIADRERKRATRRDRYNARLEGWAIKRYGEDYGYYHDYGDLEEEFNAFLERVEGY